MVRNPLELELAALVVVVVALEEEELVAAASGAPWEDDASVLEEAVPPVGVPVCDR